MDHVSGTGPDVVTVGPSGECMTQTAFHERYPRGVLVERVVFGPVAFGDAGG